MPRLISVKNPQSLQISILINFLLLSRENTTKRSSLASCLESRMETPADEKELSVTKMDDHTTAGTGLSKDEASLNYNFDVAKYSGPCLGFLLAGFVVEKEAEAVFGRGVEKILLCLVEELEFATDHVGTCVDAEWTSTESTISSICQIHTSCSVLITTLLWDEQGVSLLCVIAAYSLVIVEIQVWCQ
ncbi:hypothetical protein HG531_010702 [Fusarium graminearum]|nr:hypothetical protein HG531_010702 [Fusarium graminearum]